MDVNLNSFNGENNIFSKPNANTIGGNIFAAAPSGFNKKNVKLKPITGRLNDYDSNILENNAYQDIPDEMFKIEHKIGILENFLAKTIGEIDGLEGLGQASQIQTLLLRKQNIEKEIAELNKKYKELGLSAKISGQIASAVGLPGIKRRGIVSKMWKFFSKKVLSKFSKKFSYSQKIRDALEKLTSINANVDELITLQTPYGEKVERYEKLTAYLNKANVIHSQISENFKKNQA